MLWHQASFVTFPSCKGPCLLAILNCVYPFAISDLYKDLTPYTERMVTRKNCPSCFHSLWLLWRQIPMWLCHILEGLATTYNQRLSSQELHLNCLSHDVILLPISGGFPKNYLSRASLPSSPKSSLDWLLPPSPAYPSTQLCSWTFQGSVSPPKARHSW